MSAHRIIPMQCGDNESYALLFYDGTSGLVVDIYDVQTKALVQTVDTPFPRHSAGELRYVQSFDVMFFAQGDTYPCKLKRENKSGGGYTFSFEECEFLPEPISDWDTNSEHKINVFALPDGDIMKSKSDGTTYYPKGAVREVLQEEEITVSYSYHELVETDEHDKYGQYWSIRCYGYAPTGNAKDYAVGKAFKLTTPIKFVAKFYGTNDMTIDRAEQIDGETVSFEIADNDDCECEVNASFGSIVVEKIGNGGVYFYVGRFIQRFTNGAANAYVYDSSANGVTTSTFKAQYGDSKLYVAALDAPSSESVDNEVYWEPISGNGFELAMTIDGSNTNKNVSIGQTIALKYKASVSLSDFWDYDSLPVGTTHSPLPAVDVLEPLLSKKDAKDNELRPQTGGGYGNASEWVPVRGEVELRTEGLWSGVIELQESDANKNVATIARITSENGNSNTSLTRDIEDFGSSVRVACTRREKAYQTNRSVTSGGDVIEKVLTADEGLQWTLTTTDVQTAYLKIKEKRTLSSGVKCYIVEVVGGVNRSFATSSYALGAWSSENGYPEHVAIYQERLVYAGNKAKPTTLWLSRTNSWDDFELGTKDSSSITATLATEKYDSIQWILPSKNGILIGTKYNEYSFGAGDGGIATADNARATVTSSIGSLGIRADTFGVSTIMVKTGGEELYRIDYNTLSEEASGNQVSLLASHLFEGDPVIDLFSVKSPSNMLFCLHESGKLSSFTYEPDYGVSGWARHEVLDGVDSGCVVRRDGKDVLCLAVKSGSGYVVGEIDLQSDVWTDDGVAYESSVITTPLQFREGSSYGKQQIVAGCDVYIGEGTKQFELRLPGGDWIRVDNGFDAMGELRAFENKRVEIPATSSWKDESVVEIKSSYAFPLVLYAIGASVRS